MHECLCISTAVYDISGHVSNKLICLTWQILRKSGNSMSNNNRFIESETYFDNTLNSQDLYKSKESKLWMNFEHHLDCTSFIEGQPLITCNMLVLFLGKTWQLEHIRAENKMLGILSASHLVCGLQNGPPIHFTYITVRPSTDLYLVMHCIVWQLVIWSKNVGRHRVQAQHRETQERVDND